MTKQRYAVEVPASATAPAAPFRPAGIRRAAGAALCATVALLSLRCEADTLYPNDGAPVQGKLRYKRSSQEYVVDDADGTQMTYAKSRVSRVEVAKPAEYDAVSRMVTDGKPEAIAALEKMVSDYEMLQWDNKARDLLGYAYVKKGDYPKAISTYEDLFKSLQPSEKTLDVRRRYWDALLGGKKYDTLVTELDEVISKGTREEAAVAQVTRGNANKAQGKVMDALMDYLRTVVLFSQVKDVQPEAMFKAAECMDELRDPHAEEWRKKLQEQYPKSPYAQKVKGTT